MTSDELSDVVVVVVNYRSSALLRANLLPLIRANPGLRAVVVDNRSTAEEATAVERLATAEGWRAVLNPTNSGFGDGMNRGVEAALAWGAEVLVLLNPDALMDGAAVAVLRRTVMEHPLTLAAPRILRPDGSTWSAGSDLYLRDGRIRARRFRLAGQPVVEWLTGACLALRPALWERLDGFDPAYFLYWEDVDLSWRARIEGAAITLVESATVVHAEGGTQQARGHQSAGAPKSSAYYYYNVRNRLVFAALRLDEETARRWGSLLLSARVAYEVLLQGGRRQLLRPSRTILPAVRGLRDGRKALVARRRVRPS